jgi:hypothetical protein
MYIYFYHITEQARLDYTEVCPSSVSKIIKRTNSDDEYTQEINKKIRKCANLGKIIETKNGFEVRQYFDSLFVVKDYTVQYVYKTLLEPYEVSDEDKEKNDFIEQKLTAKNKEC